MSQTGRRSKRSTKSPGPKNVFTIDAKSALKEYIYARPERVLHIETRPEFAEEWRAECEENGLAADVVKVTKGLDTPVIGTVKLAPVGWSTFAEHAFADDELVLVLDHITDPRNLGAIARSAGFYGVKWILAPQRRQVLHTQASVATSMGGFALSDLVLINNVSSALDDLRELGFRVYGAHMEGTPLAQAKIEGRNAVVLGAEDKGLGEKVRSHCDEMLAVTRQRAGLDSLNVSVAAGIIINRFLC